MVGRVKSVHGATEAVMESRNEGDGGVEPGEAGNVVIGGRVKAVAEKFPKAFTSLERDVTVVDGGEIVR